MNKIAIALALVAGVAAAPAVAGPVTTVNSTLTFADAVQDGAGFRLGDYRIAYLYGQAPVAFTALSGQTGIGDDTSTSCCGTGIALQRVDGKEFSVTGGTFALGAPRSSFDDTRVDFGAGNFQVLTDGKAFASGFTGTSFYTDFYTSNAPVGLRSVDVSFSTPVPEPATWALMMVGVGLTGAALRRRRAATRVAFA